MYTPELRAKIERKIKAVSEGFLNKDVALDEMKEEMRKIYNDTYRIVNELPIFIREFWQEMRNLVYN